MGTAETFPKLLTTEQTGALLNISPGTLTIWRCKNTYPLAYIRVGRLIRYLESDVLRFIEKRRMSPQSRVIRVNARPARARNASA